MNSIILFFLFKFTTFHDVLYPSIYISPFLQACIIIPFFHIQDSGLNMLQHAILMIRNHALCKVLCKVFQFRIRKA